MNIYLFSSAILLNYFSMTALMLVCGLAGAPDLTADIAVVQGATLALFYAFSANARNVIFADPTGAISHVLLRARLVLIIPLAAACLVLGSLIGRVTLSLAIVLIVRRCFEWIGEIYLSDNEVQNRTKPAFFAIITEIASFVLVIILVFLMHVKPAAALILWSIAPLTPVLFGKIRTPKVPVDLMHNLGRITPNIGSTSIIGITVFIFRLSVILLVGREIAGDLFAAFAIGGILSTVYSNSIGPSLVLREHTQGVKKVSTIIVGSIVPMLFLLGAFITVYSLKRPEIAVWLHKGHSFWTAVGLSLSGGAIMMVALHRRIIMLQRQMNVELFGADTLSNVLIAVSVPYFYYILGIRSLEALYFFSAILTLCFYSSTRNYKFSVSLEKTKMFGLAALIALPVFFQLSGNIFRDPSFIFDTGRMLKLLPIPISVIALLGGTIMLGQFQNINRSLTTFFLMSILMVFASLMVQDLEDQAARLIMMAQYLLPVLALVLGDMYGQITVDHEFEKTCLLVICVLVPFQLLCTWFQGLFILTPFLYIFSIYQHLSYVPVVMATIYGSALICLWDYNAKWRTVIACMMPVMGIYTIASYSLEVLVILSLMMTGALYYFRDKKILFKILATVIGITVVACISYGALFFNSGLSEYSMNVSQTTGVSDNKYLAVKTSQPTIDARMKQWNFYGKEIISGTRDFFFGHTSYPDRSTHPSAYNYYLDFLYHFGFLPIIPLLILLGYNMWLIYRLRPDWAINSSLLATALASFVIFGIDNSLKVGLRQPYSGIFGFFILGLLQARLNRIAPRFWETSYLKRKIPLSIINKNL